MIYFEYRFFVCFPVLFWWIKHNNGSNVATSITIPCMTWKKIEAKISTPANNIHVTFAFPIQYLFGAF